MAPKAKTPSVIECHSESTLREELERARASLSLAETEDTWDTISNALLRIIALSKGGACDFPTTLTSSIRSMYRSITSAAASERSRLSAPAVECMATLAAGLGPSFDPLVPLFIPTLLSLCSRPNKVFISRAKATIQTIIDQTQLISLLPYFVGALRDKSVTLRLIAIESVLACVQSFNPPDLEKEARARDVENAIKLTATDANADVRRVSRQVFDAYKILLPTRVESFAAPLSPTMKKYLNIDISSGNSRPQSSQSTYSLPTARPTSSLAPAPPKREEPHPRPATSMSHHRSASSSTLASTKSAVAAPPKLIRFEKEPMIVPPIRQSAARSSSKRNDNMLPPAIVPQRRQQIPSEPQAPPERPVPPGRPEPNVADQPPDASTSRTATHIFRPESTQPSAPLPKQPVGPLRVEALSIRDRLLGGAQRVLLPEAQQQLGLPRAPVAHEEKNVSADVQVVPKRSRLDSVRHGPKSSATTDAKRPVVQIAATSPGAPKSPEPFPPAVIENKECPIPAAKGKKDGPKPQSGSKGKGVSTKIPGGRLGGKKEAQKAEPSVPDRPKSSMSTRSAGQGRPEVKTKKNDPEGVRPVVRKPSQSARGVAAKQTHPPRKLVPRTGGPTQPTHSQLARMKAAEEEKARRAVAQGPTRPLTIRPKGKAIPPRANSKEAEIPAAAMTTPLPPSPEVRPTDVPLPESPVSVRLVAMEDQDEHVAVLSANDAKGNVITTSEHLPIPTPAAAHSAHPFGIAMATKTPISALVNSIQRGFLLSPNSPLSPAQPDAEWECPAWPGLAINMREEPSFEGVAESTMKRPLAVAGSDSERRALVDMN